MRIRTEQDSRSIVLQDLAVDTWYLVCVLALGRWTTPSLHNSRTSRCTQVTTYSCKPAYFYLQMPTWLVYTCIGYQYSNCQKSDTWKTLFWPLCVILDISRGKTSLYPSIVTAVVVFFLNKIAYSWSSLRN